MTILKTANLPNFMNFSIKSQLDDMDSSVV